MFPIDMRFGFTAATRYGQRGRGAFRGDKDRVKCERPSRGFIRDQHGPTVFPFSFRLVVRFGVGRQFLLIKREHLFDRVVGRHVGLAHH